jgi:hypothetical protein
MIDKIIEKWDWFIYSKIFHSATRLSKNNGGFIYLLELHLKNCRKRFPISASLKRSAKSFFDELDKYNNH